jgi:hypothetical protein
LIHEPGLGVAVTLERSLRRLTSGNVVVSDGTALEDWGPCAIAGDDRELQRRLNVRKQTSGRSLN